MKKLLSFLSCVLVLMLAACTSEEVRVENPEQGLSSHLRSADEAVAIAQNLYQARHNSRANVAVANVAVIGSSASRASADTLIYAVNFADNQGFTLVSAAKAGIDIIGYTDEGEYNSQEAAENPNFSFYMDAARNYVSRVVDKGPYPGGGLIPNPTLPTFRLDKVEPRVKVQWGQRYPEGIYCPNGIAGCVQTAMAQIFSYIEKPISITYTCGEFSMNTETIDWNDLAKHVVSCDNATLYSNHIDQCTNHEILGRICRELGYRNRATYYTDATGAYSTYALETTKELLPSNVVSSYVSFKEPYEDLFSKLLGKNCVAYIDGRTNTADGTSNDMGHAWVCDGGEDLVTIKSALSYTGEMIDEETHSISYHFNWGWNGKYDGYYDAGVFSIEELNYNFHSLNYFLVYK